MLHIFDATVMPSQEVVTIHLWDQPGWITLSIDGHYANPSTRDVIDVGTRKIIAELKDEEGREVQSEKLLEIDFSGSSAIRTGDQFGLGRMVN